MSSENLLEEVAACGACEQTAGLAAEKAPHSDSEGSAISCHGASSTVSTAVLAPTVAAKEVELPAPERTAEGPTPAPERADDARGPVADTDAILTASKDETVEPTSPQVWSSKIQGPWETSRLGPVRVVGESVLCATGASLGLSLAADGRIALSNWRASVQAVSNKLEWTRVDDLVGQDLVLWVRPVSYDASTTSAAHLKGTDGVKEEHCGAEMSKAPFDVLQGRWDTTKFGTLTVRGDAVRYDGNDPSKEPLRLSLAEDGRIALLFWKAEVQPDALAVRWMKSGDASADAIVWIRLPEGAPARCGQVPAAQPSNLPTLPASSAKQRPAVKPLTPDRMLRDRPPMQRLCAQAIARELARAAPPVPAPPAERKALQSLRKTVDKYQGEIEELKKQLKTKPSGKKKKRIEQQSEASEDRVPSQSRKGQKKDAVKPPPSVAQKKRPRAKSTAMKQLKRQELEETTSTPPEAAPVTKTVVHGGEGEGGAAASHKVLSREQKVELQGKIDELADEQFDLVVAFLEPELGDPKDEEIRLDIDTLSPARQHALVAMVNEELQKSLLR